jgi:autotransporter translocation and assembly factor TamB
MVRLGSCLDTLETELRVSREPNQKYDRLRRIGVISLRVAGIILSLVSLLVGMAMLVLQTRWGGERIRRRVVTSVNHQIQGQLTIGRLSFGGDRLTVWDVVLRDPEGNPVAQVARAEVDFRLLRLLHKEVRLTEMAIDSPRLNAVSDPTGLNLSQALAPRKRAPQKPPGPKTSKEGWVIRLDRFDLRDGDVRVGSINGTSRKETVHFANLQSFMSLRYATGNGSADFVFRLDGQSILTAPGPLAISAEARVRGSATHFALDGRLLGGTIEARGDVDSQHLEGAEALIAVAIPRTELVGFGWGPVRIDGQAHPGTIPKLDLLLSAPGLELTAKGGGPDIFKLEGHLGLTDLALTGKAAQALMSGAMPSLSGQGYLRLTAQGAMADVPAGWKADWKGTFDHLSVGENVITGLSIDGGAAHLAKIPGEVDLSVAVASVVAGTAKVGNIQLNATVRQQEIALTASLATPEPLSLTVAGRLDHDRQGLALSHVALTYPKASWTSEGIARLRFDEITLSLKNLLLRSQDQALAIDGSKDEEHVDAHVALTKFRLDLLPTLVVPRDLNLGGTLDLDLKASGPVDGPKVVGRVRLEGGRFRTFSKIAAAVDATMADQRVDGTLDVRTPFAALNADFQLPVDPTAGGILNLRLDVVRLELAEALRGAGMKPQVDGRLTALLRLTGTATSPKVVLTINGRELSVKRPATASEGTNAIDVGHARIHLTYEERAAHADVDFASAHGGELHVDATARVDLSYPRVTEGIVAQKLPVHGKVVAKDFDVAWIARFNDRVEALGGQVSANAKLTGTIAHPQFVGDVRWKNGKVVAIAAPKQPARR